ncbi:MAG: N-acetylmuramoyl-L-alanine amidase family protein [Cellulosilyticaceae bacterium]
MKKVKKRKSKIKLVLMVTILGMIVITVGKLNIKPIDSDKIIKNTGVAYTVDTIPLSNKRSGKKMWPRYIVVHNTANPNSTAQNERDYLVNETNTASTSWHIAVDSKGAIEAIPTNEVALHSGSSKGNRLGIGIEICESGNYQQAEANAIKLIAAIMEQYHIPIENVKTHKDFSGKACPRKILGRWDEFLEKVEKDGKKYF